MVDASMLYTKVQTPSVRLVVGLVRTFVQYAHNKSNQWGLSLAVLACANNRQLSVSVTKCFQYRPTLVAW